MKSPPYLEFHLQARVTNGSLEFVWDSWFKHKYNIHWNVRWKQVK